MIKVKDLSFSYGKKRVLNDVSFEIEDGLIVALLGKNGVGKSTLFKCMLGLLDVKKETIFLDDLDITTMKSKIVAQKIAYIPQIHNPNFNYKVIDVVIMGLGAKINTFSMPKKEDYEKAEHILDSLGILDIENDGYMNISGGQRQLVLIARALLQDANIIIMDEPTSNLDYGNQIRILEKIKHLSKKGYTIIISTHNPQHALTFCEKSIILDEGRLISYGDTEKVLTRQILKKIYGIDIEIAFLNDIPLCIPQIYRGS